MILVIDQIYKNPDSLRALALELEFTSRARNFPGARSTRTLLPPEVKKTFYSLLKVDLDAPTNSIPYNGCFQLMRARDQKSAYVHADHSAIWAGLVYLNPRSEPNGGTLFFKHRLTGLTHYPSPKELPAIAQSFDLSPEELSLLLREDRKKPSRWEQMDQISFEFNRLVIYDAQRFHRNGKTWGSSLATGRLTHNFFFC